jgi:hypothetical protein
VKIKIVKVFERYGDVILTAKIGRESDSGSIPNPLVLTFYFNVRDGKSNAPRTPSRPDYVQFSSAAVSGLEAQERLVSERILLDSLPALQR